MRCPRLFSQVGRDRTISLLCYDFISECNKRFTAILITITKCSVEKEIPLSCNVERFFYCYALIHRTALSHLLLIFAPFRRSFVRTKMVHCWILAESQYYRSRMNVPVLSPIYCFSSSQKSHCCFGK